MPQEFVFLFPLKTIQVAFLSICLAVTKALRQLVGKRPSLQKSVKIEAWKNFSGWQVNLEGLRKYTGRKKGVVFEV